MSHSQLSSNKANKLSGWASLPDELLQLILDGLEELGDYVRFHVVCKNWMLVSSTRNQHHKLPLLLVPNKDPESQRLSLYDVIKDKFFQGPQVSVPHHLDCCGSSFGWLACKDVDLSVMLLNPFSSQRIQFPPVSEDDNLCNVRKVILTANPSTAPEGFVAVAIYGNEWNLAYIKPGDKSWTCINCCQVRDITTYQGKVYFVNSYAALVSIDISGQTHVIKMVVPNCMESVHHTSIVESSRGDMLMVRQSESTSNFKVFKLMDPVGEGQNAEWIGINSLGDDTLFLGPNNISQAFCLSGFPMCKRNCIYFIDGGERAIFRWGEKLNDFYLKNYHVEKGNFGDLCYKMLTRDNPPIWIVLTM